MVTLEAASGWGSSLCAGLLDYRHEEAAIGGAPDTRGCWIADMRRLLLGELPLRGAARLDKGRSCFLGSPSCVGLLGRGKDEAASWRSPAARGCSIGERKLVSTAIPRLQIISWVDWMRGESGRTNARLLAQLDHIKQSRNCCTAASLLAVPCSETLKIYLSKGASIVLQGEYITRSPTSLE